MKKLSRRQISTYVSRQLIAGGSRRELAMQLAAYLIESKKTNDASLILRDAQFHLASAGHVSGTVTTANELSEAVHASIEAYAKKATGASQVTLDSIVDPSVIGGVKLSLPGAELDTTISRQLAALKTQYKKA